MFRAQFKNNLVTGTKLLLATFYNKYERHSTVFWLPLYCSSKVRKAQLHKIINCKTNVQYELDHILISLKQLIFFCH